MKKQIILFLMILFGGITFGQNVFGPEHVVENYSSVIDLFSIDMNNDGDIDILRCTNEEYSYPVVYYENDGNGNFINQVGFSADVWVGADIFSSDLDNDDDNDVLVALDGLFYGDDKIGWYENLGNGDFGYLQEISTNVNNVIEVFSIDLDNDGDNDIISASTGKIAWYKNLGNGNFGNQQIIASNLTDIIAIYSNDLDNDNLNDVIFTSSGLIAWYNNLGNGNFGNLEIISTDVQYPEALFSVDIDNDDDNDIVSTSHFSNYPIIKKIMWYENDGQGNFGAEEKVITNEDYCTSVFVIDINNNGYNDILAALSENKICWYENDGEGNFENQQIVISNFDGTDVFANDLDNDGDIDVVASSYGDHKISWIESLLNSQNYEDIDLCEEDSILIYGEWISTAGVYNDTLINNMGGDSIVVYTLEFFPNPGDYSIIGPNEVEEFAIQTYSVPANPDVAYTFEVETGNVLSTSANSVEIQWGTNSMGLVKAIATFPEIGCNNESTLEVTVGTGDINEYYNNQVQLYPNPANDVLFVETEFTNINIEIINSTGQVVKISSLTKINISSLESNIYFVKVYDKHGSLIKTQKLIVNR